MNVKRKRKISSFEETRLVELESEVRKNEIGK